MAKDELKIGDRVRVLFLYGSTVPGVIAEVKLNGWCDIDFGEGCMAYDVEPYRIEKVEPTEMIEVTFEHPKLKAVLSDAYWEEYRANLVRDLALDLKIITSDCADLITNYATRIVKNLKKQSFND